VIAAASSAAKCARCVALGADASIDYSRENLREAIKALTDGRGPDVIYDPVGGDLAEPAFRSIAWRGRYLVVGFAAGGAIPALPLNLMLLKGASVVGVIWGNVVLHEPATHAATLQALLRWYAEGKLKPVIDRVLPMQDLLAAFDAMGTRAVQGKLVLVNGSDARVVQGDRDGS
jgi:NADPH2:quinone reductase